MKIKSIYIGGWFQRTTLQLSEIYDFLREGTSQLSLDKERLAELQKQLRIESIEYGVADEEFVAFNTEEHIQVKLFEDGLMVVSSTQVSEPTMFADVERLKGYYEERLSPAINYLFSLGAPVFKELSRIDNIFPYFIVCDSATQKDISELLAKTERQKYFEFDGPNYSVLRGDKYYFINNKKANDAHIEHYIEEQIFIREFKAQLHRYLNLHRAIWSKIDNIKKQNYMTNADLLAATTKLERYEKTALLVQGRLEQMSTYIKVRTDAIKKDQALVDFLAISGYRYPALTGTLQYVHSIWQTTLGYIKMNQQALARTKQNETTNSIYQLISAVSIVGVIAGLGLLLGTGLKFSIDTIIYGAILLIVGLIIVKTLKWQRHSALQCVQIEEKTN